MFWQSSFRISSISYHSFKHIITCYYLLFCLTLSLLSLYNKMLRIKYSCFLEKGKMPKQKSQLLEFFSLMDVWYPSKKQYFVHYRKKFLLCYICEYILKKNTKETLQMPSFGGVLKDLNQSQPLQAHHNYIYLRRQFRFNFMYIATIPLFVDWRPNTSQHW